MAADGSIVIDTRIDSSKVKNGVNDIKNSLQEVGKKVNTVGKEMSNSITKPMNDISKSAGIVASDFDRSGTSMTNSLNKVEQGAGKLANASKEIGDDFSKASKQADKALDDVEKGIKDVDNQGVDKAIGDAKKLGDTFKSDVTKGIDKVKTSLDEVSSKIGEVGNNITTSVSGPLAALGTGAVLAANEFDQSGVRMQNSLGLTDKEAEKLTKTAREIYNKGFGESTQEVDDALIKVKQNIKGVNDADLGKVTKNALTLADTFDADVNEVTRATNNLMESFGITSDEAFDLMADGAQKGLNFSQEMFDNLSEYSPLFGEMGFSADEYFQLLKKGAEEGVYNLDYINDAMKEFGIRAKDGSKGVAEGFGQLSKSTQKTWEDFNNGKGTVKDVHNAVIADLKGMDDKVKANQIGVALYGTKWEDLEYDAMTSLGGIGKGVDDVDGKMGKMTDNLEESFGFKFKNVLREAKEALIPLGDVLLDFAENVLPYVKDGIKFVSDAFKNMPPGMQTAIVAFGLIVMAIGPLLMILPPIISGIGLVIGAISGIGWVIPAVVAGIALLVAGFKWLWDNSEVFRETMKEVWEKIGNAVKDGVAAAVDFAKEKFAEIKQFWDENGPQIMTAIEGVITFMKTLFDVTFPYIVEIVKNAWEGIKHIISGALDMIMGAYKIFAGLFTGDWEQMWEGIKQYLSGAGEVILGILQSSMFGAWLTIMVKFFEDSWKKLTDYWDKNKKKWDEALKTIGDLISVFVDLGKALFKKFVTDNIEAIADFIKKAKENFNKIKEALEPVTELKGNVIKKIKEMKDDAIKTVTDLAGKAKGKFDEMKTGLTTSAGNIYKSVKGKFDDVKTSVTNAVEGARKAGVDKFQSMYTSMRDKAGSIYSTVRDKFNSVKDAIMNPINKAKDSVSSALDKIKGFFSNLRLKIPTPSLPSMPHFSLNYKSKTLMGKTITYPTGFDVNWYAKGGLFDANSPQLIGVGDNTSYKEAAIPLSPSVLGMIGDKISKTMTPPQPVMQQSNESQMPDSVKAELVIDGHKTEGIINFINNKKNKMINRKKRSVRGNV